MNKILACLLIIVTIFSSIFITQSLAVTVPNLTCPTGTKQLSNTFYCADAKNVYGNFGDIITKKCQELSSKTSLACTNKVNVAVTYNAKSYDVALQRWSLSFFNRIINGKFCPNGTTFNVDSSCKNSNEVFGNFSSNFINLCLLDYDAQTCLTNRIAVDKFNAIGNKIKTVTPVTTVTTTIKPTSIIEPTVTPKVVNGYNVTSLITTPTTTIRPTNASFWNVVEGFDYSGNLKQVYDKNNHSFTNGTITLGAKKALTVNPVFDSKIDDERFYTKSAPYQGTKLILKDKFQYGHISFVATLPNSKGTMPAIWLFDEVKGQYYTEVDLFEIPGSEVGNIYTGTHYGQDFKTLKSDFSFKNNDTLFSKFHKYEVYKTPTKIVTLIDGQLVKEINVSNKTLPNGINGFNQPLNLIMNLNIGDKWAGAIDDSKLPTQMVIKDMVIENY